MSSASRELPTEVRRHILVSNGWFPALAMVLLWGLYLALAVFDVDILSYIKRRHRETARDVDMEVLYFWGAIVGTALAAGFAWFSVRRALCLARDGVEVIGQVTKVGRFAKSGFVRVNYEFTLDGKTYKKAMSCLKETAIEYRDGGRPLELVCDPRHPRRVMLKSDVFPMSTPIV
jgi:hypothetical protein